MCLYMYINPKYILFQNLRQEPLIVKPLLYVALKIHEQPCHAQGIHLVNTSLIAF